MAQLVLYSLQAKVVAHKFRDRGRLVMVVVLSEHLFRAEGGEVNEELCAELKAALALKIKILIVHPVTEVSFNHVSAEGPQPTLCPPAA